jgi:hypothetical protein
LSKNTVILVDKNKKRRETLSNNSASVCGRTLTFWKEKKKVKQQPPFLYNIVIPIISRKEVPKHD